MLLILVIAAVIGFFVWYFLFRKKPETPPLTIFFQPSDIILNPDRRTGNNIENYTLEYAGGCVTEKYEKTLGKNVDLEINWTNGFGFNGSGITGFMLTRTVCDKPIGVSTGGSTELKVLKAQDGINVGDGDLCTVLISGAFVNSDDYVAGRNIIEVFALGPDGSQITPSLGSFPLPVPIAEINKTVDLTKVVRITVNPITEGKIEGTAFNTGDVLNFKSRVNGEVTFTAKVLNDDGPKAIIVVGADEVVYDFLKYTDSEYVFRNSDVASDYYAYNPATGALGNTSFRTPGSLNNNILFEIDTRIAVSVLGAIPSLIRDGRV